MSDGIRVEVRVRGRLGGDVLAMLAALGPQAVPRHTVLTVAGDENHDLAAALHALERARVELERVVSRDV